MIDLGTGNNNKMWVRVRFSQIICWRRYSLQQLGYNGQAGSRQTIRPTYVFSREAHMDLAHRYYRDCLPRSVQRSRSRRFSKRWAAFLNPATFTWRACRLFYSTQVLIITQFKLYIIPIICIYHTVIGKIGHRKNTHNERKSTQPGRTLSPTYFHSSTEEDSCQETESCRPVPAYQQDPHSLTILDRTKRVTLHWWL